MLEIERKYRISREGAEALASRVQAGAARTQIDEVYLLGASGWDTFTPGQPVLRIRQEGDVVTLAVKAWRGAGTASEAEAVVDDIDRLRAVVLALGAVKVGTISKERREGRLGKVTVAIDDVEGLGCFAELEILLEPSQNDAEAQSSIARAAEELGLSGGSLVNEKYDVMLAKQP